MEKRYQVFVSSTFVDLREERQRVIQALMEMDCMPSGMELFPAADEEQWEFIKRVIDDCDYYLLIIGGRYGSTTPEGISYTEKEYDYAVEKGMKVVALLHANPEEIPLGKSEADPESRGRLKAFREKVSKSRLVKQWRVADELPGLVALSLAKTIKMYPAVGWVRADQASNTQLLNELNEVRKKNGELQIEASQLRESLVAQIPDLASLDEHIEIYGKTSFNSYPEWRIQITWRELFAVLSPFLIEHPNDTKLRLTLAPIFCKRANKAGDYPDFDEQIYQTLKIQFQALGLVTLRYLKTIKGDMALFWSLTQNGQALMVSTRSVKSIQ